MNVWKITTTIFCASFFLAACFPATPAPTSTPAPTFTPAPTDTPAPTPTLDPCATIQIVSPRVESETNAAANQIDSETVIQWVPSNCVLTVQTYQNNTLMSDIKDVVSGTSMKFGEPGSGKTQIKVWWNDYEHSTWVYIK
jgi:hypothetical protein